MSTLFDLPPDDRQVGEPDPALDHNKVSRYLRRGPTGQIFDVRDYEAACDGVTDDSPFIQAAVTAAQAAGSGVVQLGRRHAMGSRVVITKGITIQGGGSRATIIEPLQANDDWLFSVEGNGRNGEFTILNTGYDRLNDQSGTTFRGFHIVGNRGFAHKGIRVQRDDDFRMEDVQFSYLKGTALQLGAESIAEGVGSVRESELNRVKIYACGDLLGVPALVIQNAAVGATGDGTNQVRIHQMYFVYNFGGAIIRNLNTAQTLRRLTIADSMFHGASHPSTGTQVDHDLLTIEGGIISIIINNFICNSTGATPLAAIKLKANPGDTTKRPQGIDIDHIHAASMAGDVLNIDSCSDFSMRGRFGQADIDGAIVRVATTANLLCYDIAGIGGSTAAPTTKFVIPSTFTPRGTVRWGGKEVVLP